MPNGRHRLKIGPSTNKGRRTLREIPIGSNFFSRSFPSFFFVCYCSLRFSTVLYGTSSARCPSPGSCIAFALNHFASISIIGPRRPVVNNDKGCNSQHPQLPITLGQTKRLIGRDIQPACKIEQILESVCVTQHN